MKRVLSILLALVLVLCMFTACGEKEESTDVRKITVGLVSGYKPYVFVNENNECDGYEVDVMKAVDELLPQYEFTFEAMEKNTLLLGLEAGTYPIALDGFLYTAEREEKYLYPEHRDGASIETIVVRQDETAIHEFGDLSGRKLAPISASSNFVSMCKEWNDAHPDKIIDYSTVESANRADTYAKIVEGVYDGFLDILQTYNELDDEVKAGTTNIGNIGEMDTYPLFNKNETELAKAVDECIVKLMENGTLSELSVKWFKEDLFAK